MPRIGAHRSARLDRRRWLLDVARPAALLMVAAASESGASSASSASSDRISQPPPSRTFESPNGGFVLVLDLLAPKQVTAELFELGRHGRRTTRWRQALPHEWGPATAVVADSGSVVLIDEWIHVVSRRALTLLSVDGRTIVTYPAEQLFSLLGVPRRSIAAAATSGVWRTGEPAWAEGGKALDLFTAGRRLRLFLDDGRLQVD